MSLCNPRAQCRVLLCCVSTKTAEGLLQEPVLPGCRWLCWAVAVAVSVSASLPAQRCESSWPFRKPGAVSWHPEHSRAVFLAPCWCRKSGRNSSRGGSWLCRGPEDLDSFLAAVNPAERRGSFMKVEGSDTDTEMPDIKPVLVHGIFRGISGA